MSSARMDFDRRPEAQRSGGAGDRYSGSNLFIAARPDAVAARAAQALARDVRDLYRIGRQPLPDWRLHVSLIGLDRHPVLPASLVYHAREALDAVRFEPFVLAFDSVYGLQGSSAGQPVALVSSRPNPALRAALSRLAGALDGLGVRHRHDPDFLVHMTLIYHDRPIMPERLAAPVEWVVDEFWLIHSLLGRGSYEFLWPPEGRSKAA